MVLGSWKMIRFLIGRSLFRIFSLLKFGTQNGKRLGKCVTLPGKHKKFLAISANSDPFGMLSSRDPELQRLER